MSDKPERKPRSPKRRTPLEAAASVIGKENKPNKPLKPSDFGFRPTAPGPCLVRSAAMLTLPLKRDERMSVDRLVHPDREEAMGPKAPGSDPDEPILIEDEAWDEEDHDRMSDKLNEVMYDHFATVGSATGVIGTLAKTARKEAKKISREKDRDGWFKRMRRV